MKWLVSIYERKGRVLAESMIKFCIFQLDLGQILEQQQLDARTDSIEARLSRAELRRQSSAADDSHPVELQPSEGIEPPTMKRLKFAMTLHSKICIGLCVFFLFKYSLICALSYGLLGESASWLDCWLLGRYRLMGRTVKINEEIALAFIITIGIIRVYLASPKSKKFRFDALKFLMSNYESLSASGEQSYDQIENKNDENNLRHTEESASEETNFGAQKIYCFSFRPGDTRISKLNSNIYFTSQLITPSDNIETEPQRVTWIMRPNRTPECWLKLNSSTVSMLIYSVVSVACCILGFSMATLGSILTDFGYELSYPTCVAWIRREQVRLNSTHAYEHIYRVVPHNKLLANELPIEQVPAFIPLTWTGQIVQEWRLYNVARITIDILENALLNMDCLCLFGVLDYVLFLNISDIVLYANRISARLKALIKWLELQRHETTNRGRFVEGRHAVDSALTREIGLTQAILHDHFDLVHVNDRFIGLFLRIMCFNWALGTFILCAWMQSVKSRTIELEFLIIETLATCYAFTFLAMASSVHSKNVCLYQQMTRLMALDSTTTVTKIRWLKLLKFYHPKSLFCFTLFSSSRISRLFCLKLISWVVSVFVVMANFFYATRR